MVVELFNQIIHYYEMYYYYIIMNLIYICTYIHALSCVHTQRIHIHESETIYYNTSNYYCELYLYIVLNCSIISVTNCYML